MSTTDYTLSDQGAAAMRAELNVIFAAIVSKNSSSTEPTTTFAYMWWYDTSTNILKIRNKDNDAWISLISFDQTNDLWYLASLGIGTAAVPRGGVGSAISAMHGTDSSQAAGPHQQVTTSADNHPLFQRWAYSHDDMGWYWDSYIDSGGVKSSDAGSNFRMRKYSDKLYFDFDTGIAQGSVVTFENSFYIDLTTGVLYTAKSIEVTGNITASGTIYYGGDEGIWSSNRTALAALGGYDILTSISNYENAMFQICITDSISNTYDFCGIFGTGYLGATVPLYSSSASLLIANNINWAAPTAGKFSVGRELTGNKLTCVNKLANAMDVKITRMGA